MLITKTNQLLSDLCISLEAFLFIVAGAACCVAVLLLPDGVEAAANLTTLTKVSLSSLSVSIPVEMNELTKYVLLAFGLAVVFIGNTVYYGMKMIRLN